MGETILQEAANYLALVADRLALPAASSLGLALLSLAGAFVYYRQVYGYWRRRGIRGPRPWPLIGNLLAYIFSTNRLALERLMVRKHGKVYGVFMGHEPCLVVADPGLLHQISVKNFESFSSHDSNELHNDFMASFLFFLNGDRWRRVRAIISPAFTSCKVKRMARQLNVCIDEIIDHFREQMAAKRRPQGAAQTPTHRQRAPTAKGDTQPRADAVLNLRDPVKLGVLDGILSCLFGIRVERVRGAASDYSSVVSRNELLVATRSLFIVSPVRHAILFAFPRRLLHWLNFKSAPDSHFTPTHRHIKQLIVARQRHQSRRRFNDYLQLLLDSKLDSRLELDDLDARENHHADLTHASLRANQQMMAKQTAPTGATAAASAPACAQLTEAELISNAILLGFAGLDSTSSTLTSCIYALAHHPEIQERLHRELVAIARPNETPAAPPAANRYHFSHEALVACEYLDCLVSETLRTACPIMLTIRRATRDVYLAEHRLHIRRGQMVVLSLYGAMNDQDSWPEPQRFDPSRFLAENRAKIVPGAYCPFGLGPRHCVGMRFSLYEIKLALAKLVTEFQFAPAPGTRFPSRFPKSPIILKHANPLVKIFERPRQQPSAA